MKKFPNTLKIDILLMILKLRQKEEYVPNKKKKKQKIK